MNILHIAYVEDDRCNGVAVAVPAHVIAQQLLENTALLNLTNVTVANVQQQFSYVNGITIGNLPKPFCSPDIIVFHELYRPPFLKLADEAFRRGIPYVIVPHGGLTKVAQQKKRLKKWIANALLFQRFFQRAACIQYLSVSEKNRAAFSYDGFIGTNGIVMPANAKTEFNDTALRLVFIGRYEIQIKGIDLLMEAMANVKKNLSSLSIHLDLYGPDTADGCIAAVRALVEQYKLADYVTVHGVVYGAEKEAALLAADGFIQSSRSEGMPMGVLEALSYGLPCIVTKGTGMTCLIDEYHAGISCDTTADAIAQAIQQFVNEAHLLPSKSQGALRLAKTFECETVARNTLEMYSKLINR